MIGFLKKHIMGEKPRITRAEVLGARPVRNPAVDWERNVWRDAQPAVVLLHVPRRADRWGDFVARVFRLPSHRNIELDEMGSDVWEMCDGAQTVESLTRAVCAKYHLNRRQGEASVTAYMRMLAERRLLALRTANPRTGGAVPAKQGAKTKGEKKPR
jgi:hypothetical protein